ncbi:predicted protein [Sclerotinia sclerotiorum 1980 UF-70]|uniref:Uncharacterized protein n=1 Tax=Sclerotinia sclerotiorum (strain ATCC 18683 / 1980 / Ss-1) TaxID=665079 RepID=A7EWD3_SCLS1|nr:predicted protein [Sclerotinia sclerotiorum 1980 UF-70]EDN93775.1 predicted protein [Sclerotinia sclerotiorum 1980 UF-70]
MLISEVMLGGCESYLMYCVGSPASWTASPNISSSAAWMSSASVARRSRKRLSEIAAAVLSMVLVSDIHRTKEASCLYRPYGLRTDATGVVGEVRLHDEKMIIPCNAQIQQHV